MTINQFEDIIAWQKAQELAVLVYDKFHLLKDYSFKDQICRAAVSVSNNIAEGFERGSDADFCRFLYIAKGSNAEVKSMLYLAYRLNFMDDQSLNEALLLCTEIKRILSGLINKLNKAY